MMGRTAGGCVKFGVALGKIVDLQGVGINSRATGTCSEAVQSHFIYF